MQADLRNDPDFLRRLFATLIHEVVKHSGEGDDSFRAFFLAVAEKAKDAHERNEAMKPAQMDLFA